MVAIPVRLYKAARRERVRFRHVYAPTPAPEPEDEMEEPPTRASVLRQFPSPPGRAPAQPPPPEIDDEAPEFPSTVSRVRESVVSSDDAKPVARESILKGFETAKDEYVVFKPSEIAALRPRTSTELPIVEFVRIDEIDPIFFDTSYYVAPEKGGERPFALLAAALSQTGCAALGTLAMHGREHAVVLRAARQGLVLHTLFYANEVRADDAWRADAPVNDKELELAAMLIRSMEATFDPSKLKDTFEERLRAMIDARAPIPAADAATPSRQATTPAIDIMEALRKSIAARKPIQPEQGAKTSKGKKRRA